MPTYKPSVHIPFEQSIFERFYLDTSGCYVGIDLRAFDFPYAPCEHVPANCRYGAATAHKRARQLIQDAWR